MMEVNEDCEKLGTCENYGFYCDVCENESHYGEEEMGQIK